MPTYDPNAVFSTILAKVPDNNEAKITPADMRLVLGEVVDDARRQLADRVGSPNHTPGNFKQARFLTNAARAAAGGTASDGVTVEELLARHATHPLNLGTFFLVELPVTKLYVLQYDGGGLPAVPAALRRRVFRTGDQVPGDTINGVVVEWGSADQARATFRAITLPEPTPPFAVGEVGIATVNNVEGFYKRKSSGTYALPTGLDDANWWQVAPPAPDAPVGFLRQSVFYHAYQDEALGRYAGKLLVITHRTNSQPDLYIPCTGSGQVNLQDAYTLNYGVYKAVEYFPATDLTQPRFGAIPLAFSYYANNQFGPFANNQVAQALADCGPGNIVRFNRADGVLNGPAIIGGLVDGAGITITVNGHLLQVSGGILHNVRLVGGAGDALNLGPPYALRQKWTSVSQEADFQGKIYFAGTTDLDGPNVSLATLDVRNGSAAITLNLYGQTVITDAQIATVRAAGATVNDRRAGTASGGGGSGTDPNALPAPLVGGVRTVSEPFLLTESPRLKAGYGINGSTDSPADRNFLRGRWQLQFDGATADYFAFLDSDSYGLVRKDYLVRYVTQQMPNEIGFQFAGDSAAYAETIISSKYAGTYSLQTLTGAVSVAWTVNGAAAAVPITVVAGDVLGCLPDRAGAALIELKA
jgi:hypothetical protein